MKEIVIGILNEQYCNDEFVNNFKQYVSCLFDEKCEKGEKKPEKKRIKADNNIEIEYFQKSKDTITWYGIEVDSYLLEELQNHKKKKPLFGKSC